ncbi:beta-N-acetylglucosaminidase domain-containing protein [Virgibacillus litoralis]|uniref:Hyaluronoglucosaminidase n=1 Tax=Virgibacillus litoralis TaxID=578221 RepID=A0ABS4H8E3_9BACI|nr:beta-N-acetylglucosaminidase domain-containing protein [Virgibacillus litoralis]MBP1947176.1 hyaluronoglucosaminidase [Virgibacillus litoralis]
MAHYNNWRRILMVCSILLLCVPFLNTNKVSADSTEDVTINPKPQEMKILGEAFPLTPVVGIVVGKETDEQAIQEVVRALKAADVKQIVRKNAGEKVNTPVTIWIGGPSENQASADVLNQMGVNGTETLKDEGYTLVSANNDDKQIVLAGKDKTGTFYAAETFKQIIQERKGRDLISQAEIRDWPEMPIRGSIEGFYGPTWTHDDRLSQIEFYGENKLNTYIYAPKDDPYHRENWREPYPDEELKKIEELIDKSKENHVNFTFSLSPGQSICYSGDDDFALLKKKMEKMWDLGVRSYAIFLDDISKSLHCEQDKDKFGDDADPIAAAHAHLLNRFTKEFIQTHEGAERLITVPTDYSGNGTTVYRERFAELLHKDTVVMWTGPKVVSEQITSEGATKVRNIFQHDLLIWDNYPVNDFDRNSLFLGPLVKRDSDLTENGVVGLTTNPMNEAEASKIPMYTIADYTWNPAAYEPRESWERSVQSFGGDAADVLKTFAENSYSSPLNETESLTLTPLINEFWKAYVSNNADQAADELIAEFKKLQQNPAKLQNQMENDKFLLEVEPYLEKLKLYGEAGEVVVNYLMAQQEGEAAKASEYRKELITLYNQSEQIPQKIGQGVIKPFLVKSAITLPSLSLTLQPSIDDFWEAYDSNDIGGTADNLISEFDMLQQIPDTMRQNIDNEEFLKSIEPYLKNLDVYGEAGEVAVNYLIAQKEDQPDKASEYQEKLRTLMVQAYKMPQKIGEQTIKPFLIDSMWGDLNVIGYRMLDGVNTFRGGGELIQYTPEHGDTTGTNPWGYEVTVVDDTVVERGGNNSAIPDNGYVLSIHANDWLRDNATIEANVQIENGIVLITKPEE